ncbi:putative membrane protein [Crocosphaera subtropica ATCC 51142]|uniref:Membrane protein n=1 Tax=Crocosphaera subtropica (strain ATCC 51142 / BH68) TaxID=43989 RepID=B1X185_CROS5|nr:6-pyruvoyl-tetrahydropterin synthase-related protein [Crocosphaera subtropica]ACB49726.1 putative membrane protein [Crocosphaera subtropica ATCC 51142]
MTLKDIIKSVHQWLYKHRLAIGILLLYSIVAISLMAPMASSQIINGNFNDTASHVGYIAQARTAIIEGQFPLRVAPLENNSWRYPGFQFYSQLPYFIGGWFYKLVTPTNPYEAYKLVIIIALTIGGFYIYRLSCQLTQSRVAAILAGVAYMSAPYFLNNIHARGAFTEAIAQGILPVVLYYVIQCYLTGKRRYLIFSAISWFCLAVTHIITFVYGTLFFALLALIVVIQTRKTDFTFSRLIPPLQSYGLGWLLGFYFLAPVVFISSHLAISKQLNRNNPFYTNNYTPLANLLSPTSLPPEPSETGLAGTYGLHPAIGWILLGAWLVVMYYYYFSPSIPAKLNKTRPYMIALLWVFAVALFLTWSPINIWAILPRQLWVTQFTFRLLTHVMWAGALLTAYATVLIFRRRLDRRHLILGILIIVFASRPWLPAAKGTLTVDQLLQEPLFRYSGALDYLDRSPITTLYGKAELPLLHPDWTPGYSTWNTFVNHPLLLEAELRYPVWEPGENPVLFIEGEVPLENIAETATLEVHLDGKVIGSFPLVSRELKGEVPLPSLPESSHDFGLKFVVQGETRNGQPLNIRVKQLFLDGMLPKHTLIPVTETEENCQQQGVSTVCEITVSEEANIVQLPVLYYPDMLKVWVNDKGFNKIFAVYYRDYNLTGLDLKPGTYTIRTTFHGLAWANWISGLAWLGLISMMILPNFVRFKDKEGRSQEAEGRR